MRKLGAQKALAVAGLFLAVVTPASAAEPRVQTARYTAGALGDAELNLCAADNPTGQNVDRVCFKVTAGKRYKVQIADDVNGSEVGYLWVFRNKAGDCVGDGADPLADCPNSGLTCGTNTFGAPKGAVALTITLDGPAYGPLDCLVDGDGESAGIATQGTVKVTRL